MPTRREKRDQRKQRKAKRIADRKLVSRIKTDLQSIASATSKWRENCETWRKWFEGDESVYWDDDRPSWKPRVIANFIESNVRTKVAMLTDSKPKFYIYGMPQVDMIESMAELAGMYQQVQEEAMPANQLNAAIEENPGLNKAEGLRRLTKSMDFALDHIWRLNEMHDQMKEIVLDAAITGLLTGRAFFNDGTEEIEIEHIHPRHFYFDKNTKKMNIEDGSCDKLIISMNRPLTWFDTFWPDQEVKEIEGDKDKVYTAKMGQYIEAYYSDPTIEETEKGGVKGLRKKYPSGRKVIIGGDTILYDGPIDVFPYVIQPYERNVETLIGEGDVRRMVRLQEDYNSKLCQISMNITLTANRQFVMNPAKCDLRPEVIQEHAGEGGYVFITGKTINEVKEGLDTYPPSAACSWITSGRMSHFAGFMINCRFAVSVMFIEIWQSLLL